MIIIQTTRAHHQIIETGFLHVFFCVCVFTFCVGSKIPASQMDWSKWYWRFFFWLSHYCIRCANFVTLSHVIAVTEYRIDNAMFDKLKINHNCLEIAVSNRKIKQTHDNDTSISFLSSLSNGSLLLFTFFFILSSFYIGKIGIGFEMKRSFFSLQIKWNSSNLPVMPDNVNSKNIGKYIANVWISCVSIWCCLRRRRPAIKQTRKYISIELTVIDFLFFFCDGNALFN